MDLSIELEKSSVISPHLPNLCDEAAHFAYARESDLRAWANPRGTFNFILIQSIYYITLLSNVLYFLSPPLNIQDYLNSQIYDIKIL